MTGPIEFLLALPRFTEAGREAYRPGFERILALLEAMGDPHRAFRTCHVAGTNGKGSTASMLVAILSASGTRTGLHTSPHLLSITERMRVDGRAASDAWLEDAVAQHLPLFERVRPSFFEATVALSMLHFAEEQVDVAVIEVGLGGRLDATNVVQPDVAVITSIGLEHTDILGDTIGAIAAEKAGIIKNGVPVVVGDVEDEARDAIERVAALWRAEVVHVHRSSVTDVQDDAQTAFRLSTPMHDYGRIGLDLAGAHQIHNARLAVLAAERAIPDLDVDAVRRALADVRRLSGLRGRLELIEGSPPVLIDVAHNADGIGVALRHARFVSGAGRLGMVLALMKDKDVAAVAHRLKSHDAKVCAVGLDSPRAFEPRELASTLRERGVDASPAEDLQTGLRELASCALVMVAGSHLLAAEALRAAGA